MASYLNSKVDEAINYVVRANKLPAIKKDLDSDEAEVGGGHDAQSARGRFHTYLHGTDVLYLDEKFCS
jgi:hypothetical protein